MKSSDFSRGFCHRRAVVVLAAFAVTVGSPVVAPQMAQAFGMPKVLKKIPKTAKKAAKVVARPVKKAAVKTKDAVADTAVVVAKQAKEVAVEVKDAAVDAAQATGDTAVDVKDVAVKAAKETFEGVSDATQVVGAGLDAVDDVTLNPVKKFIKNEVVLPVRDGVVVVARPVTNGVGGALGQTFDAFHMDPMGGSWVPFGDDLGNGVGWASDKLGLPPEVMKDVIDPTRVAGRVVEQGKQELPVFSKRVLRQAYDAVDVNPTHTVGATLGVGFAGYATTDHLTAAAIRPEIVTAAGNLTFEEPHPIEYGTHYGGRPVYYVNGIDTPLKAASGSAPGESASGAAQALSDHLRRPVRLIYNPTDGAVADVGQSFYDRLVNPLQFGPLRGFQGNATTRQLAHLLTYGDGGPDQEINVVSHSQGCLLVNDALAVAAGVGGRTEFIAKNVRWVACGAPFSVAEVQPRPLEFTRLSNPHDAISQGVSLTPASPTIDGNGHGFVSNYVSAINPDMLQ